MSKANCIKARYDSGPSNLQNDNTGVLICLGNINPSRGGMSGMVYSSDGPSPTLTTVHGSCAKVAIPVLTPERAEKRQNGRRFKEDGDPSFTLTAQDRHGAAYGIDDTYARREPRFSEEEVHTLRSGNCFKVGVKVLGDTDDTKNGFYVEFPNGAKAYAVWYEKEQCYLVIRKLTPKECFRLQGWDDKYFERAKFVNSDSQLYKQAGNGVTVDVVYAIGKKIEELEK